ncbi:MAG TPA: hypothetical protein VGF76_24300 [Polyangiaceae bacterium]
MSNILVASVSAREEALRRRRAGRYLLSACGLAAVLSACTGMVVGENIDPTAGAGASGLSTGGAAGGLANTPGLGNVAGGLASNGGLANAGALGNAAGGLGGSVGGPPNGNGLSCELNRIISTTCQSCHGVLPNLVLMASRSDLLAPSVEQPSERVIDVALARMKDPASPMPPSPLAAVPASDVALMSAWVSSGTPVESCGTNGSGGVGGSGVGGSDAGGSSAGGSGGRTTGSGGTGGSTPVVCTSGMTWTGGNGSAMRPGNACRSCHGSFSIAGTIYPTEHEPTNCDGVNSSSGIKVVITGSNGTKLTLTPSSAGNFYSTAKISTPYTVTLTGNGTATRSMLMPQTSGDCNSCHTQNGSNSAPGRIMAP